jgi:hypothetical protein
VCLVAVGDVAIALWPVGRLLWWCSGAGGVLPRPRGASRFLGGWLLAHGVGMKGMGRGAGRRDLNAGQVGSLVRG